MRAESVPVPIRRSLRFLMTPLRTPISWLGQHGMLPPGARKFIPYRWATQPFTLYGDGWSCKYQSGPRDAIGDFLFLDGLRNWERETTPKACAGAGTKAGAAKKPSEFSSPSRSWAECLPVTSS